MTGDSGAMDVGVGAGVAGDAGVVSTVPFSAAHATAPFACSTPIVKVARFVVRHDFAANDSTSDSSKTVPRSLCLGRVFVVSVERTATITHTIAKTIKRAPRRTEQAVISHGPCGPP